MHLRVADVWYFLVTVVDGYSRYVVHWELLESMRAADVRPVIQHALEANGVMMMDVQIVSDNGSQFMSADSKALVRQFELQHIRDLYASPGILRRDRAVPPQHAGSAQ
jgi:putative transposase